MKIRIDHFFAFLLLAISTYLFSIEKYLFGLCCIGLATMMFSSSVIHTATLVEGLDLFLMSLALGFMIMVVSLLLGTVAVLILR